MSRPISTFLKLHFKSSLFQNIFQNDPRLPCSLLTRWKKEALERLPEIEKPQPEPAAKNIKSFQQKH